MWNRGFAGWYYKHQRQDDMIAFIPGRAESGAFVQMLTPEGSRQFMLPELSIKGDSVRAGGCLFSPDGCRVELPGVRGEIVYGKLTPLRRDIMGPFRYLPMECRHGVVSMAHTLSGSLIVDGVRHCFDGGMGYVEKDSGTSFPSAYQWLQCNDFPQPCALMAALARIPLGKGGFTGCICSILYRGREYRFATYGGVRILKADAEQIRLAQGKRLLAVEICPTHGGHPLYAPCRGRMTGIIRESANAAIRVRLWENGRQVFDLHSPHAAYEYVPPATQQAELNRP